MARVQVSFRNSTHLDTCVCVCVRAQGGQGSLEARKNNTHLCVHFKSETCEKQCMHALSALSLWACLMCILF